MAFRARFQEVCGEGRLAGGPDCSFRQAVSLKNQPVAQLAAAVQESHGDVKVTTAEAQPDHRVSS